MERKREKRWIEAECPNVNASMQGETAWTAWQGLKVGAALIFIQDHLFSTEPANMEEREQPQLQIIGVLHGDITTLEDAPKNYDISNRTGSLEIYPAYQDGLDGIEAGQTIVVLFWLHRSSRDLLKVYPRGDRSRGLRGVFATRSPARPNPIAISELKVEAVDGNRLQVSGLDILDGTPIIDIKKKISS